MHTSYNEIKQYKQAFSEIILSHKDTHEIFFTTITFQSTFKKLSLNVSQEYFDFFYRKLSSRVTNDSKDTSLNPRLLVFPEESFQRVKANMESYYHFHILMLIQKRVLARFAKRILNQKDDIVLEKLKHYHVNADVLNPYPKSIKNSSAQRLKVDTELTYLIDADEAASRVSDYCSKNFSTTSLNHHDVLLFS